jgi:predicted deacylase
MISRTALHVPGGADAEDIDLPLLIARGAQPGPHVVVLGGVHGDEYEGRAAAALISRDLQSALLRGSVSIIPTANAPACEAGTRTSPIDNLNLARTFPGSPQGSVTERIADVLASLIRQSDFLIDLHSAGQQYAMPLLCGSYVADDSLGERCEAAALAFGAPIFWAHPEIAPGRSLSVALEAGIPCLYAECGGGGRVRPADLATYRHGVRRVLAHLGMLAPIDTPPPPSLRLCSGGNVDLALSVSHPGILVEHVGVLDRVCAGDLLGTVHDSFGTPLQELRAPTGGILVMARRTARVHPGDGAYLLAHEEGSLK